MSFSERQRKWKEELDQELERKRGRFFFYSSGLKLQLYGVLVATCLCWSVISVQVKVPSMFKQGFMGSFSKKKKKKEEARLYRLAQIVQFVCFCSPLMCL